ncbi:DNA methyltransferase [Alphaproteobacteria bacterium]|nr:DNA methyltransferase [Alphaproteobacteria bacterium]
MVKARQDMVMRGDCIDAMRQLDDASIDMIFADPPYNMQLGQSVLIRPDHSRVDGIDDGDTWDQFGSFAAYDSFTTNWMTEARRILKPDGTIWVIGSYHNIFRVGTVMQNLGFWTLNDVIWLKSNPMPNFRGRRMTNAHETLIWASRQRNSRYTFNYQAMKTFNDDRQLRSDWWLPICSGNERLKSDGVKAHPTQKPEALLARVVMASTRPGDVILDPFFGTGTTGVVAKRLRRHWIGIEADPEYATLAEQRIEATRAVGDPDLLEMPERRAEVKIPFGALLDQGLIKAGDKLTCEKGDYKATVRVDGSLKAGDDSGSIHSLAAKLQGRQSCNGWTFWYTKQNRKTVIIDALRQEARSNLGL